MAENFMDGLMKGYAFVSEQKRAERKDAREQVLEQRQDKEYQNKLDLNKVQALRYAIAATPPGQDPTSGLTQEQRDLLNQDPGVQALLSNPELREHRRKNLGLIDEGFQEYYAALTAPPAPVAAPQQATATSSIPQRGGRLPIQNAAMVTYSAPEQQPPVTANGRQSGLSKMLQGAQGEWGDQINSGKDRFGADVLQTAKEFPGVIGPDGSPLGKQIVSLHPSADGKALAFEVKVTTIARDEQGQPIIDPQTKKPQVIQYTAPLTQGRDGSPEAPVLFHPISVLTHDLQMRGKLLAYADARAVSLGSDEPIKAQREIEKVQATKAAEMQVKQYDSELKMLQTRFEQGEITKRELEVGKQKAADKLAEIAAQGDRDERKIKAEIQGRKEVAGIEADSRERVAKTYATSREKVADLNNAGRKAVAELKADPKFQGDAKFNAPQATITLMNKLRDSGTSINGLEPGEVGYEEALKVHATATVKEIAASTRPSQALAAPSPQPAAPAKTPAKPPAKTPAKAPATTPAAGLSPKAQNVAKKYGI